VDLVVGGANTGCTSLSAPRPWPSSSLQVRPTAAACLLLSSEGMKKADESLIKIYTEKSHQTVMMMMIVLF